jgi:type IV secretory pathway VirB2 component (pilin)
MAKGVCMKDLSWALGLIFVLGLVLVFLRSPVAEGFYSGGGSAMNACGADMP